MTGDEDVEARLAAVERRLEDQNEDTGTDGERVAAFETRLAELEAAVEAIEGYVGELERVDREFERRVDAALSSIDDMNGRVDALDERLRALGVRVDGLDSSATTGTPISRADGGSKTATTGPNGQAAESTAPTPTTDWDATGERSSPRDSVSGLGSGASDTDPNSGVGRSRPVDDRTGRGSSTGHDAVHTDGSGTDIGDRCPSCGDDRTSTQPDGGRSPDSATVSGWGSDPDPVSRVGSGSVAPEESDPVDPPDSDEDGPDEWAEGTEERGLFRRLRERL